MRPQQKAASAVHDLQRKDVMCRAEAKEWSVRANTQKHITRQETRGVVFNTVKATIFSWQSAEMFTDKHSNQIHINEENITNSNAIYHLVTYWDLSCGNVELI